MLEWLRIDENFDFSKWIRFIFVLLLQYVLRNKSEMLIIKHEKLIIKHHVIPPHFYFPWSMMDDAWRTTHCPLVFGIYAKRCKKNFLLTVRIYLLIIFYSDISSISAHNLVRKTDQQSFQGRSYIHHVLPSLDVNSRLYYRIVVYLTVVQ